MSEHLQCHDAVCNSDGKYPRGTKGVSCSCSGRDLAYSSLQDIRSKCIAFMPSASENPALRKWVQSIVDIVDERLGTNWLGEVIEPKEQK